MGGEFWECAAALQGHNPAGVRVMAVAPVEIDITGRRDLLCLLRSAPTEPKLRTHTHRVSHAMPRRLVCRELRNLAKSPTRLKSVNVRSRVDSYCLLH